VKILSTPTPEEDLLPYIVEQEKTLAFPASMLFYLFWA
jgi:hypothetical protein